MGTRWLYSVATATLGVFCVLSGEAAGKHVAPLNLAASPCAECYAITAVTGLAHLDITKTSNVNFITEWACSLDETVASDALSGSTGVESLTEEGWLAGNGRFDKNTYETKKASACSSKTQQQWADAFRSDTLVDNGASITAWDDCIKVCHSGLACSGSVIDDHTVAFTIENGIGGAPKFDADVLLPIGVSASNKPATKDNVLFKLGTVVAAGKNSTALERSKHQSSFTMSISVGGGKTCYAYFPPIAAVQASKSGQVEPHIVHIEMPPYKMNDLQHQQGIVMDGPALRQYRGVAALLNPDPLDSFGPPMAFLGTYGAQPTDGVIPDKEAQVTYMFDNPVVVRNLEVDQYAWGILAVEGFAGDNVANLPSIGTATSDLPIDDPGWVAKNWHCLTNSNTQPYYCPDGIRAVFRFNFNALAGRVFRFRVTKTVNPMGNFAIYRAYPHGADGERILPVRVAN